MFCFVHNVMFFACIIIHIQCVFLQNFIAKPSLVATCLAFGEEHHVELTNEIAHVIIHCCYGNSFLTDDYKQLLEVVLNLLIFLSLFVKPFQFIQIYSEKSKLINSDAFKKPLMPPAL